MELQITRNQLFKKQVFCDYIHTKKLKKVEIFLNKGWTQIKNTSMIWEIKYNPESTRNQNLFLISWGEVGYGQVYATN